MLRKRRLAVSTAILAAALAVIVVQAAAAHGPERRHRHGYGATATPIQHLVVIIGENEFLRPLLRDLPSAPRTPTAIRFTRRRGTPAVDGLPPATSPSLPPALQARHRSADRQPERGAPAAARLEPDRAAGRRRRTAHVRPGPQLQRRAGGVRRREDGPVRAEHRAPAPAPRRFGTPARPRR